MSYQDDTIDWQTIATVDLWLDNAVSTAYISEPLAQDWARISKVIEELGEAVSAMIGYTGQNPRKGYTHSRDDMLNELADVVATGLLAIQHFTKNSSVSRQVIRSKMSLLDQRVAQWTVESLEKDDE